MKTTLLPAVLLLLFPGLVSSGFSAEPKWVAVAGYTSPGATQAQGDHKNERRIFELLTEHKIKFAAAGSAGYTVSVPEPQADEARKVLAKAVKEEKLAVLLYKMAPDGKRAEILTPESVLAPEKK